VAKQRGNDGLEHLIARGVAKSIVDRLQAIDVEHDQGAARTVPLDEGDRAMELALEPAPVRNSSIRANACANCVLSRRMVDLGSLDPARAGIVDARGPRGATFRPAAVVLPSFAVEVATALVFFFMAFPVQACL
jgi:hypothetical protein